MKTKYFTVNESCPDGDEFIHIGTISANDEKDLQDKLILALSEHFDTMEEYIYNIGMYSPDFDNSYNQSLSYMVDSNQEDIIIRETWIY